MCELVSKTYKYKVFKNKFKKTLSLCWKDLLDFRGMLMNYFKFENGDKSDDSEGN